MSAARPELLLVHGAWHGAWAWTSLLEVLTERGWQARAVDLPSAQDPAAGIAADGERLRAALAERETPTVLVGHSYGGTVITQGGAGVDHVAGLVYVCAARPDIGEVVWKDQHSPDEVPDWIEVDDDARVSRARRSEEILYNDCTPEVVADARSRLRPQSLASFLEPITAAAWHDRPYAYLVCEIDQCVPAAGQEELAKGASYIERLEASHSPFLSRPSDVEAFLGRAVASF